MYPGAIGQPISKSGRRGFAELQKPVVMHTDISSSKGLVDLMRGTLRIDWDRRVDITRAPPSSPIPFSSHQIWRARFAGSVSFAAAFALRSRQATGVETPARLPSAPAQLNNFRRSHQSDIACTALETRFG
jgi:hypothetical protein